MTNTTDRSDLQGLKRRVGRQPFDARVRFTNDSAACPFHSGETDTSMHLFERDGVWLATCFSDCKKTWDAIGFVQNFDKCTFPEALQKLGGSAPRKKEKPKPLTEAEWLSWGREITEDDVKRLSAGRPNSKTPGLETLKQLGCRGKEDYIGIPYRQGQTFHTIKLRHLDSKTFSQENSVSQKGLFNIDAVTPWDDVYVVEAELDAGVLTEAGFVAVSVVNSAQKAIEPAVLEALKVANRILLVGDQDQPGRACMDELRKLLPLDKTFRIEWPESIAKDVGDLAKQLGIGFAAEIERLTDESLQPWVTKTIPTVSSLSKAPQRWVVERMLPYGGLTILCGKQGALKSLLGLWTAKSLTTPMPDECFGRKVDYPRPEAPVSPVPGFSAPVHGWPVLYLDRENPEAEVNRRREAVGIALSDRLYYWGDWSPENIPDEPDDPRLMEFATRNKGFIIFDSLQDWYGDASEIDNTAMTKLMHKFKRLARAGAGVLVLHHVDKAEQAKWRGATAITGLCDMAIHADKVEDVAEGYNRVIFTPIRFRMCSEWEMMLKITFKHPTLPGAYSVEVQNDGPRVTDAQKRADERRVKQDQKAQAHEADKQRVVDVITEDPSISIDELGNKLQMSDPRAKKLAGEGGWTYDKSRVPRWLRTE